MIKHHQEHTDTFAINNNNKIFVYIRMETEKEIEYKSTIMEMGNIIKNQERVIEELMFDMLDIKIDIEEVDEVDEVVNKSKSKRYWSIFIKYSYRSVRDFYWFEVVRNYDEVHKRFFWDFLRFGRETSDCDKYPLLQTHGIIIPNRIFCTASTCFFF